MPNNNRKPLRRKKKKQHPQKKTEDDDSFDPFADDDEDDQKEAEEMKKQKEAEAKKKSEDAKKKGKAPIIAKSSVCFDVKGYEVDQDWDALALKIRTEVNMDGLIWMDVHKVVPVAFGMKKLQMTMLIEDEKVQTDDVFELIEAWEDDVQSVDVVSFNKA